MTISIEDVKKITVHGFEGSVVMDRTSDTTQWIEVIGHEGDGKLVSFTAFFKSHDEFMRVVEHLRDKLNEIIEA